MKHSSQPEAKYPKALASRKLKKTREACLLLLNIDD